MKYLKSLDKTVSCMKPVSAGCEITANGLRNDDAVQLLHESSVDLPYEWINPYAFEPPIAPHIAALQSGNDIQINNIKFFYTKISSMSEAVIVEGAGGWLVPVNEFESMADIAAALNTPVILVVGLRLGCINHGLLTANSIEERGIPFKGWIANHVDKEMLHQQDNIEALKKGIGAPLLGSIEFCEQISQCQLNLTQAGQNEFK